MKSGRGFTLVEMMVTMAIIGLLATVAVVQFRYRDATDRVKEARNVYRSMLILARSYTQTGKTCCDYTPTGYGVGIAADRKTIHLFANRPGDFDYSSDDTILQTYVLDDQVVFDEFNFMSSILMTPDNNLTIYYNGENWSADQIITTTFTDKNDTTISASVTIYYPTGLID